MSLESAKTWVKYIHKNEALGAKLMTIDNWDSYFSLVKEEGYEFTKEELDQAWEFEFGNAQLSDSDLDKISGGSGSVQYSDTVLGVRG